MEKYTGKSIFKGIAIGKILFYQKGEQPVKRVKIEDTAEQIKRYEDARAKAAEQLQGLYEKAGKQRIFQRGVTEHYKERFGKN